MSAEIEETILHFVRRLKNGSPSIAVDTDLISTGVLDSLSVMELVSFLSKKFNAKISVSDITPVNLRSVAALSVLVEARSK